MLSNLTSECEIESVGESQNRTYAVVFVVEGVERFAAFAGGVFRLALVVQSSTALLQLRQLHPANRPTYSIDFSALRS